MMRRDQVLLFVNNNPGCTRKDLTKFLGYDPGGWLQKIMIHRLLDREWDGMRYRYYITEQGLKMLRHKGIIK